MESTSFLYYYISFLISLNWIFLWFLPNHKWTSFFRETKIIPLLVIPVHTWAMIPILTDLPLKIWTFESLLTMNDSKKWFLGVWIHMATYDLFVGEWIISDAKLRNIPHRKILPLMMINVPCGMIGLAFYLLLRKRFSQEAVLQ